VDNNVDEKLKIRDAKENSGREASQRFPVL